MTVLEQILIAIILVGLLTHAIKVSLLREQLEMAQRLLLSERRSNDRLIARVKRLESSIRGIEYGGGDG